MSDALLKIGFTMGDINGIGLEVTLKALRHVKIFEYCIPIIYGSGKIVSYHKNILDDEAFDFNNCNQLNEVRPGRVNIINLWNESYNITLGKPTEASGQVALRSLEAAVNDLKEGSIHALVTAPISKQAMQMAGFPHVGHTEFLAQAAGAKEALMLMISRQMKLGLVTAHVPLMNVPALITKELVQKRISQFEKALKRDFGYERPTIAVMGLNPHAGDEGLIGTEDNDMIRPAIIEAKKSGSMVMGPFSADGFFGSGQYKKFDGILAMYHDQGLIPFKALSFGDGVNYSAGLNMVRTSPDHGTAFEIAGKNEADAGSMVQAIFTAIDIVKERQRYAAAQA
jgi:4-hydroxythreonine-4-phosphate dehydrogenase